MRLFRIVVGLLVLLTAGAAQDRNPELHKVFAGFYEEMLQEFPELATSVGRNDHGGRWTDYSAQGIARRREMVERYRKRLQEFRKPRLNEQDRLSLELLDRSLAMMGSRSDFEDYYLSFGHMRGLHSIWDRTLSQMPANTPADYQKILARLESLPRAIEQLGDLAETAVQKQLLQPRRVIELTLRQYDRLIGADASSHPLLRPFGKMPATIPAREQERLRSAAIATIRTRVQPALKDARARVAAMYLPKARGTLGLSSAFNGGELYAIELRGHTTTSYTADEIHQIGWKEVKRIQGEMAEIRSQLKFAGSAEEFVQKVLDAPEMRFKTGDEILRHARDISKRIDPELPRLFKVLPRMPYGVRAIPEERARTEAPHYQSPAVDGSRAGNFFIKTVDPEQQSRCCMEALVLHEAVPGHHLQNALAREMQDVPDFRRIARFTAFGEGWGLYAESLGPALGMYQSPYERYGKLQTEIMRAVRLVVDTGLHAKGWTPEQAIELMRLAKGGFINEEFIAAEIDRYISWPGQAVAYKIGGLKIEELRARAERELGAKFDVRDFHDVVLRNGSLPLDILEEQVTQYIAQTKR